MFTIRSDSLPVVNDVDAWLAGSNVLARRRVPSPAFQTLLRFDPARVMFNQRGMPRRIAEEAGLPVPRHGSTRSHRCGWASPTSRRPAAGQPQSRPFQGNASARLTTAWSGDYFDNASIQHLSHVILDLEQFYLDPSTASEAPDDRAYPGRFGGTHLGEDVDPGDRQETDGSAEPENDGTENDETFLERVQYMFRSTPPPALGFADQTTDGGGPTSSPTSSGDPTTQHSVPKASGRQKDDTGWATSRLSSDPSRAQDGSPIHLRMDGPGFDSFDVPDGSNQPKLQFSIFVPTSDFFARMRSHQASVDLARAHGCRRTIKALSGPHRHTPTEFLVPPRRHRAFPLIELADENRFI